MVDRDRRIGLDVEGVVLIRRMLAPALCSLLIGAGCAADPPSAAVGIVATGCPPVDAHGSGMVIAPGLVLTSAHVLAGATEIDVYRDGGHATTGEIVGFDPEMDMAYVAVPESFARPVPVDSDQVESGGAGVAYVYRDRAPVALPVVVRRRVRLHTEDIYIEGETFRPGLELDADIVAGDSGAPVVIDGRVAGVIWARSRRYEDRAYAIDAQRAAELIDAQRESDGISDQIDLARCR